MSKRWIVSSSTSLTFVQSSGSFSRRPLSLSKHPYLLSSGMCVCVAIFTMPVVRLLHPHSSNPIHYDPGGRVLRWEKKDWGCEEARRRETRTTWKAGSWSRKERAKERQHWLDCVVPVAQRVRERERQSRRWSILLPFATPADKSSSKQMISSNSRSEERDWQKGLTFFLPSQNRSNQLLCFFHVWVYVCGLCWGTRKREGRRRRRERKREKREIEGKITLTGN